MKFLLPLSPSLPDIWQAKLSLIYRGRICPPLLGDVEPLSRRQRCPPPHPHNRQEFNPATFSRLLPSLSPSSLSLSLSISNCV